MKREIDRIADEHDRAPAYVIRELLIRGLTLYQQDGQLREELGMATSLRTAKTQRVGVLKEKAK
jgi:hypothetical protein